MTENSTPNGYALITGGTSGIGYEIAKCFAKDGYDLVLVARTEESLSEVAIDLEQQFQVDVLTIARDLVVPGAAKQVFDEIKARGIKIEALVNDAGMGHWGKFTETELDKEIDLVHLNVIALVSLTKYFLKDMLQRGQGKILQVASALAKAPSPYFAVYAATKAFVLSFTEAVQQEIKDTGVTMTALLPGATDTDFFHKAGAEDSKEYKETSLYDPREVAEAAYKAMMDGEGRVQPGLKNKMQGMMGTVLPDSAVAANMEKHLEPSHKNGGRENISHPRSAEERERIEEENKNGHTSHVGHVHEDNTTTT